MKQEPAYILNRRIFKESSLLIDVITPHYGVLSLVANGALNQKRGWAGLLQAFQPLLLSWSGRSALKTLNNVEMPGAPLNLKHKCLFSAYYLNELLLKMSPKGEGSSIDFSDIFIAYVKAITDLENAEELEPPLRYFEYLLLSALDLFPECLIDIEGRDILENHHYYYLEQIGFTTQDPNGGGFKHTYPGSLLLKLHSLDEAIFSSAEYQSELKRLMRQIIQAHLGNYEFKSRALFLSK